MNNKIIFLIIAAAVIVGLYFLLSKNKNKKPTSINNIPNIQDMPNVPNIPLGPDGKQLTQEEMEQRLKEAEEMLGYNLEDEEKIMEKIKLDASVDHLAQYADKITKQYVSDEKFLQAQLPEDLLDKLKTVPVDTDEMAYYSLMNPTTLGNSAYIVINAQEPYKSRAKQALDYLLSKL